MDWEATWIRQHVYRYESKGHAEAVILNIEKRKRIMQLENIIKNLEEKEHVILPLV